ncbi:DUF2461 domain-containing protein [Falsiroseomonas sp. HW251]|uniref:DUF2461 domain-containing protein n=1 Tax=Falsiroseomonas sp. HW251 TaxID=3390998 RepID=UPI003D31CDB5
MPRRPALAPEPLPLPPFAGFPTEGLAFLRDLATHQDRAWFEANKATYATALRAPMEALMAELGAAMARRRIPLGGDPRKAVFRIHRDVRFSRDKSPYKTHVGAILSHSGGGPHGGVLYVHVAPEGCFAAAGFWQPEPKALDALRRAIAEEPAAWRRVTTALAKSGLALDEDEGALKRNPRGYEAVIEDAIRRRSFTTRRALSVASVATSALAGEIADFAAEAAPLLRWGWAALGR